MKNYIILLLLLLCTVAAHAQVPSTDGTFTAGASGTANNKILYLRTWSNTTVSNRLAINNTSGFVGINQATPLEFLHVTGTARADRFNASNGIFSSTGATNLTFYTNATTAGAGGSLWATILNSNGYVGINTASGSIAERLHVTGNVRTSGNFISDAGVINVNHASNPMVFQVNGTERIRVLNSGNVGVGTVSPATKFEVDFSSANTTHSSSYNDMAILLRNNNSTLNNLNILGFASSGGSPVGQVGSIISDHFNNYGKLFLATAGPSDGLKQRMLIDESGNIGIGTLTPATKLQIDIASSNTAYASATASDISLTLKNANITNNNLNILNFADGNGFTATQIGTIVSNHTSHYGKIFFATRNAGGLSQRMVITENGDVEIGSMISGNIALRVGGTALAKQLFVDSTTPQINTAEGASYLSIFNHEDVPNGLNAGGLLVSDDYGYATPAAGNLVVKGAVGIGTPITSNPNGYKLAVNGKIGAKDVQIETSSTTWPDYVFDESYNLPALTEVAKYVKENKHLEGMPSAEDVTKNGYSVNDLNEALLKKVEELTLYVIEQQKQIDELKQQVSKKKGRK